MSKTLSLAPPAWNVEPILAARRASSPWAEAQGLPARFYSVYLDVTTARTNAAAVSGASRAEEG